MWKSASNQPTRTITFEHDMLLAMHEMTPKLVSMWPCSWLAFMQNLKEFGHLTHIVSRSVSILGFFSRENLSKCIKSQNSMKFIMDALHGDVSVSKKLVSFYWCEIKVQPDLPYQPTQTTTFEHGVLLAMHEITPIFASMWACLWQASIKILKKFGHRTLVVSRSASVLGFFSQGKP